MNDYFSESQLKRRRILAKRKVRSTQCLDPSSTFTDQFLRSSNMDNPGLGSLKKKADNASTKFRNSMSKKGRRSSKRHNFSNAVPVPVPEVEELKCPSARVHKDQVMPLALTTFIEEAPVNKIRHEADGMLQVVQKTKDMSWQKPSLKVTNNLPAASISSSEYISTMKRMAELEDTVAALSNKKPDAHSSEKEKVLANALTRIEALERELASTKKVRMRVSAAGA